MYRSLVKRFFSRQATPKGGKLYYWKGKTSPFVFDLDNVTKVALGLEHWAFITENGNLFTSGKNSYGQLGHNTTTNSDKPQCVEFFEKNHLRVVDVSVGEFHTLALTHDGDVWSFGRGNKKVGILKRVFTNTIGALGHADGKSHSTPTPITTLRSLPPAVEITSGKTFNILINKNQDMYNWGKGELSVFGNGSNKNLQIPTLNEHFEYLRKEENLSIKKLKSCNNYSMALMSDNSLYGWGLNEEGQMGINETGGEMYETYYYPTKTCMEDFQGSKIVDFDISENVLVFVLDNGEIYWSGRRHAFKPERVILPIKEIPDIIAAGTGSWACVVGPDIYSRWDFLHDSKGKKNSGPDLNTGIITSSISQVFNGASEVVKMGGGYSQSYAIVN